MNAIMGEAAIAAGEGDQSGASDMTDLKTTGAPVMHSAHAEGNMAAVATRGLSRFVTSCSQFVIAGPE
jgi:hypothetical protein